jgi:predicted RNA polymerase sigma factor
VTACLETYQPYWAARADLLSRVAARRGDETSCVGTRRADGAIDARAHRADSNARTVALNDARRAYDIAIGLERDPAVRAFLLKRQNKLS